MTKPVYCEDCMYFCKNYEDEPYCGHEYKGDTTGTAISPSDKPSQESQCDIKNSDNECLFHLTKHMSSLENGDYTRYINSLEDDVRDLKYKQNNTFHISIYTGIFWLIIVGGVFGATIAILHL